MAVPGQPDGLNAPPPNPATDPKAAQESSPIRTLTGGMPPGGGGPGGGPGGPGSPGAPGAGAGGASPMPQGPDMSGILMLGQKLSEGMLTLAQAVPSIAGQVDQARAMLENALAQWMQTQGTQAGMAAPGTPLSPPPGAVTQSGTQFPGGGFGAGRAF